MTLSDLNAEFVGDAGPGGNTYRLLPDSTGAQGVTFDCPNPTCEHGLLVWFRNPIGAEPVDASAEPAPRWRRTGDTIDALTLEPSVDAGCWHGWVQGGVAR